MQCCALKQRAVTVLSLYLQSASPYPRKTGMEARDLGRVRLHGQMNLSECMQAMQIQRKLTILKGALILREILGVRVNSKEETTRMAQKYTDAELSFWISFLREESHKAADIREKEAEERIQWEVDHDSPQNCMESGREYTCCTNHDYGPLNPWDAPGMSVRDFI